MSFSNIHLLLGTNLGDKKNNILTAIKNIQEKIGKQSKVSSIYESEPWGVNEPQDNYYNLAIQVITSHSPTTTLAIIHSIEESMGRFRKIQNESRIIDIDILLWEDKIIKKTNLEIPHPRLHLRKFALVPLEEIGPEVIHPVFNLSIQEILRNCTDLTKVIHKLNVKSTL
ncbi:MAG: 2-amino-4-hydroxy-6-hydroxymethyldihydropteridine diphosphokinase [Saprospiraceae bacterium]|nr:2-amino-4-hydroxy-6-hydroxymethyldihydropteridine diphosphokinase [Saprospiraceae bacterium]